MIRLCWLCLLGWIGCQVVVGHSMPNTSLDPPCKSTGTGAHGEHTRSPQARRSPHATQPAGAKTPACLPGIRQPVISHNLDPVSIQHAGCRGLWGEGRSYKSIYVLTRSRKVEATPSPLLLRIILMSLLRSLLRPYVLPRRSLWLLRLSCVYCGLFSVAQGYWSPTAGLRHLAWPVAQSTGLAYLVLLYRTCHP